MNHEPLNDLVDHLQRPAELLLGAHNDLLGEIGNNEVLCRKALLLYAQNMLRDIRDLRGGQLHLEMPLNPGYDLGLDEFIRLMVL
ncbi:hypothetical protein D3C76_1811430 [compost metagenome]